MSFNIFSLSIFLESPTETRTNKKLEILAFHMDFSFFIIGFKKRRSHLNNSYMQ